MWSFSIKRPRHPRIRTTAAVATAAAGGEAAVEAEEGDVVVYTEVVQYEKEVAED